jgi:hypothetical protein
MADKCLVCDRELKKLERRGDAAHYDCGYCGPYRLTGTAEAQIRGTFTTDDAKVPRMKSVLSHAIRRMSGQGSWANIDSLAFESIVYRENWLPSLSEQANNFILWLGANQRPGHGITVSADNFASIIGTDSEEGAGFVISHTLERGLISGVVAKFLSGPLHISNTQLTFSGWQYYDNLKKGSLDSRKAFMAMKYGDIEMDTVFEQFKQSVAQAGFDLVRLDQRPVAGLIDDSLRVEIRTSRFLISDLTHGNAGAYWEAGYAEGLGKPVIYSCRKDAFKEQAHFDTNHHLTVMWELSNLARSANELKATIRATLPTVAKMMD